MSSLSIVFAGTPEFGIPCLNGLFNSPHNLIAVYTQPDRPAGRGRTMQASAVKEWALEHHIPVYQPLNFKSEEALRQLAELKPDVLVVIAYGLILPAQVLAIPKLGCINVHASLLPRWRGASPIQQAILNGDAMSGVTIMEMEAGLDTGPMYHKVACPILDTDTAKSLHDRLASLSIEPLIDTLNDLALNRAKKEIQDNKLATYAPKINKADAQINWYSDALDIDRKIRAFNPWPIAYTHIKEEPVRIYKAKICSIDSPSVPGTILSIDKQGMLITCTNQAILVEIIQFPGSKPVSVADWVNTGKAEEFVGLVLS